MANARARRWVKYSVVTGIVAVVVILIATSGDSELVIFGGGPSYPHKLQLTVANAFEATQGERVAEGGIDVGSILSTNVTNSGKAHLVLGIANSAWPIPTDSAFALRMNGTIKFTDRYIQITKGHADTDFANDALVPARHYTSPVEYDSVFNIFNAKTLGAMKSLLDNGGPFFSESAGSLHQAIAAAPPALSQVDAVFRDIDSESQSFSALINSGAAVTKAVATANPDLQQLLTGAASTFTAVASESDQLKATLSAAPRALTSTGTAARHFATTIGLVRTATQRLNPGINQLREISEPLTGALHEVVAVEPPAVQALRAVTTGGRPIQAFLSTARTSLMPQAKTISSQLTSILQCVRPYTPDLASFIVDWGSYLGTVGLKTPRTGFFNALLSVLPFTPETTANVDQIAKEFPAFKGSLFPEVPGEDYNQPWYQPQCGETASSVSVAEDTENNTFDPLGAKTIDYPSS